MNTILEQDDSLDMKEVAVYPRFMIRNAGGDYWSNENGWTDYSDADVFNHVEQQSLRLPVGGEWVSVAESMPTVGSVASDLKAMLGEDFVNKAGDFIHDQGLLYELEWNPKGRLSESLSFVGQVLTVRVNLNETDSKRLHLEQCQAITKDLAAGIKALLPEDARPKVQVVPRTPQFDHWNERWNCELIVVESTEDELDVKDVYFSDVPPDFAMPQGLSAEGRAAWHAITSLLGQHDALKSGGHTHVFYSPEEWAAKREQYGEGSELIVVHDGGSHAPYFNGDYGASQLLTRMTLALAKVGCYPQPMTCWGTAIHKKDEPDEAEIEALEQWLKERERRPLSADQERLIRAAREAADEVGPVDPVEESEDDDIDVKDLELPPDKEGLIRHLFGRAGLRIAYILEAPPDPDWGPTLGSPRRIIHTYLQPSNDKPWSTVNRSSPELATFCQQMKSYLYTVLDTDDIDWTTRWDMDVGAWEITWHIGDPEIKVERRIEDDKPVQEGVQDDDDFLADVTKPDRVNTWDISAQWKAFVRGWWDTGWQVMDDRLHAVNREGFIDGYMTRNLKDEQAKSEINRLIFDKMNGGEVCELDWFYHPASGLVNVTIKRVGGEVTLEALGGGDLDAPIRPCVHCGYCCKKAPCPYGEPDTEKGCKHLTADNKCGVYDKAKDDPVSPAFGTGCCSPMNSLRLEIIKKRKKLGESDDEADWKDLVPEYKPTKDDIEQVMNVNGIIQVMRFWDGNFLTFRGLWKHNQTDDQAETLVRRVLMDVSLPPNLASALAAGVSYITWGYEPHLGQIDLNVHRLVLQDALRESEGDDFDAKDMLLPGAKLNVEDIKQGLKDLGAQGVTLWTHGSNTRAFIVHWPGWTLPDTLRVKGVFRALGLADKDVHWIRVVPSTDNFMVVVPRRFLLPHRVESASSGVVNRIMEAGGTVSKVQETEQQDVLKVSGEWNKGQTLDALAEALAVDKEATNYDPKTGTFTTLTRPESLLQEASMVQAAILYKRTGEVATGATHSEAMERFLEQGLFGKVRSLADLEALGEKSNAAYNRIWNQVEIGFLTRRGEFVTREEASRITGIPDVHGEDLAENSEEGDDKNRVAIVAVFRQRKDEGYDVLVCKREYAPAEGEWVIPGGHAEEGEKIEAAARREMKEETKVDVGDLTFVKKMPNETGEKQVFVYGTVVPYDEKAKAGDDAEKVKWLPLDDLPKLGLDNDELIREIAEKMELTRKPVQESEDEDVDWKDTVELGHGWEIGPSGHSMALVKHPQTGFRLYLQYRSTVDNPLNPGTGHHVFSVELKHHLAVKDRQEIAALTMNAAIEGAIRWANDHPAFREVRDHWVEESVSKFSSITDEMMPALEEAVMKVFPDQGDWVIPHVIQYMDPSLSVVAIENGRVVGFYILGKRSVLDGIKEEELTPTEDLSAYQGKKGIEGVALGIIPEARGSGLGSKLKDYPQRLGADYIWGLQLHSLGNLEHWLKRRRVVAKNEESVATLQDYAGPVREGLEDDIDPHELTTTPATEENLIQLFSQSGLQFDKAEDYGPHYRQFIGAWEPRRQPGQVVAYWTKVIEDTMGLNPHDFGFGYDPETGRMSVLVRKAVIQ